MTAQLRSWRGLVLVSKKVLLRSSPAEKCHTNQLMTSPAPRRFDLSGTTILVTSGRWFVGTGHIKALRAVAPVALGRRASTWTLNYT